MTGTVARYLEQVLAETPEDPVVWTAECKAFPMFRDLPNGPQVHDYCDPMRCTEAAAEAAAEAMRPGCYRCGFVDCQC